jgi:hypothetical protein
LHGGTVVGSVSQHAAASVRLGQFLITLLTPSALLKLLTSALDLRLGIVALKIETVEPALKADFPEEELPLSETTALGLGNLDPTTIDPGFFAGS